MVYHGRRTVADIVYPLFEGIEERTKGVMISTRILHIEHKLVWYMYMYLLHVDILKLHIFYELDNQSIQKESMYICR